jgi:hypothetical protein
MACTDMIQHNQFLIDLKPQPLRDSTEWTTHFAIFDDLRYAVEPIKSVQMGNRCKSEADAREAGLVEAKRIILEL